MFHTLAGHQPVHPTTAARWRLEQLQVPRGGATQLISERYLFGVTAVFLLASVGALAYRYRERRGLLPAALGLAGAAMVLAAKFKFESMPAMYTGLLVLIASSIWNSWPQRLTKDRLVQLSVNLKGR